MRLPFPSLPPKVHALLRLMRLHQPTGFWLLLWPCLWGIALASPGVPDPLLLLLFTLGALVMRSAGCVINDLVDRNIDGHVERTKTRPLVTGEVSAREAMQLLGLLLLIGTVIVLNLNKTTILLGLAAMLPVCLYPFMKRITHWPQLFLGLVFNWGALMGWTAVTGHVGLAAIALYIAGISWTLGYDTIYAHQDKRDDARIGVKSTALALKTNTKLWLERFYKTTAACLLLASALTKISMYFYSIWILAAYHLYWQVQKVDLDNPADCMAKFRSNALFGAIVFVAIVIGKTT